MKTLLNNIATLSTGVYAQPDIIADTYYLQANHFINNYQFDNSVKPYLKLENKYEKHLLNNGDILFRLQATGMSAGFSRCQTPFLSLRKL